MKTIKEIADIITVVLKPSLRSEYAVQSISLFGSYATGTAHEGSDIDLYVITNIDNPNKRQLQKSIRRELSKVIDLPIDILIGGAAEWAMRSDVVSTLEYKAKREGAVLYER